MTIALSKIRDLLLPAIWAHSHGLGGDLRIETDFANDCLWVINGKNIAFKISRREIEDGSFMKTFEPQIRKACGVEDWV